jgi:hypothetical protein
MMSVAAKFLVAGWRRADFVCVRVCARVVVSSGFVVSLVVWLAGRP